MIRCAALLLLAATATAQPLPQPKIGTCPSGYHESGGYCTPMRHDTAAAIAKGSRQCPAGWAQSGSYCVEMRPPRR